MGTLSRTPTRPISPPPTVTAGQYPNARQADGGAHHLGIDHIAFDLLEDHQEDQEGDRLERGDHQQQQSGKNRPDVGPGHGDERGGADDDPDERGIVRLNEEHADGAQSAQNAGLDKLAGDEVGEGIPCEVYHVQDWVGKFWRDVGPEQPGGTGRAGVPCRRACRSRTPEPALR